MKEIKEIIRAYDSAIQDGKQCALASVVLVEGSSYRRPGARMLITEDGTLTGSISGGCLEGDALRKALLVMASTQARVVIYDTSDEDDAKLGVGLGCNGIIHILIEPIIPELPNNPIQLLKRITNERQAAIAVTLFSTDRLSKDQPGTALVLLEDGTVLSRIAEYEIEKKLVTQSKDILLSKESRVTSVEISGHSFTVFLEYMKRPVCLVIAGAGNDAVPMIDLAINLGWEVVLADGRPAYATKQRFPKAKRIIVCKGPDVSRQVSVDEQTVFLLMTHNYNYDLDVLRTIIRLDLPYIGVLGPKKRLEKMINEMNDEAGGRIHTASNLYGPVGLDLGSETPEEIALSVIAEIQMVLNGRSASSLRDRQEPIHERSIQQTTSD
jgi:xanthine dehydrogenase accessory factor